MNLHIPCYWKSILGALTLICILSVLVLGCDPLEKKPKKHIIGIVNLTPRLDAVIEGFKAGLAAQGYIEGKNIEYIYQGPATSPADLEPILDELIKMDVDLIFCLTTPAAKKAKMAVSGLDIPIVFAPIYAPVRSGIVSGIVEHKENITGVKIGGNSPKALEWLLKIDPEIKRVFVPFDRENSATRQSYMDLSKGASKLGVELVVSELSTLNELKDAFSGMPEDVDAIWLLNSFFLVSNIDLFMEKVYERRIPIGAAASQHRAGVLVTYGQFHERTGKQAGHLADKVLRGAPARELPVEMSDFFLGINLRTAQRIGLEVPEEVLEHADSIVR